MEKKKDILVSIITVCYNSEETIENTIKSVLQQTYKNIEYIIVDGKSKDGTLKIIEKYQKEFGDRLYIISEPDAGIYDAMNKGIHYAHGEVIGILNSDDFYEVDAVENIISGMSDDKYQILYGALRIWKNGIEESISLLSHSFLEERMINHPACFVTKSVYEDFGVFDTKYTSVADYEFMLRMSQEKAVCFIPIYHIVANFTWGGMSTSVKAYMDLVKLQKDKNIITKWKYYKICLINKIYGCIEKLKCGEKINVRKM